jgi:uncharacterized protein YukE
MLTDSKKLASVADRTVRPHDVVRGAPAMLEAVANDAEAAAKTAGSAQDTQASEVRSTYDEWVGSGGDSYRWRMALERKPPESLQQILVDYAGACKTFASALRQSQADMEVALNAYAEFGLADPIPAVRLHHQSGGGSVEIDRSRINAYLTANPGISPQAVYALEVPVARVCTTIEEYRDAFAVALMKIDSRLKEYPTRNTRLGPSATDATTEALLHRYGAGDGQALVAGPGSALSDYVQHRQPVVSALNEDVQLLAKAAPDGTQEVNGVFRADHTAEDSLGDQLLFHGEEAMIRLNGTTTVTNLPDGSREVTVAGTYTLQNRVDPLSVAASNGTRLTPADLPGQAYQVNASWPGSATFVYGPDGSLLSQRGYP